MLLGGRGGIKFSEGAGFLTPIIFPREQDMMIVGASVLAEPCLESELRIE